MGARRRLFVLFASGLFVAAVSGAAELWIDPPVLGFAIGAIVASALCAWRIAKTLRLEQEELQAVGRELRERAAEAQRELSLLRDQRNELNAVLSSMSEIVVAIDRDRRIINLNGAAEELLGGTIDELRGRPIEQAIRSTEFQSAAASILEGESSIEDEITFLGGAKERQLYLRGSTLSDAKGRPIGALLMLNEVTEIKRLETIRRDFVANVSHELRTPITSIKGFVETLLDGAINNPEDARRFLEIIHRQAERLAAIIEDLLSLSAIEEEGAEKHIRFREDEDVRRVVLSAVEICAPRAAEKQIEIAVECPEQLTARINDTLIEQALINLIDNAIKYSNPGTKVRVRAEGGSQELVFAVGDEGPGIERVYHDRLFERFYRVDKGRARNKGGTGLGLAIVKHIAQVHGGAASVESTPGEGSTFSITIPLSPPDNKSAGLAA